DCFTTECEENNDYEDGGHTGDQGPAQCVIQRVVDDNRFGLTMTTSSQELTYTVKYNHAVVDGITNNRQDSRNEGLINLHSKRHNALEYREQCKHGEYSVNKTHHGSECELPLAESDQDVDKHQADRNTKRFHRRDLNVIR